MVEGHLWIPFFMITYTLLNSKNVAMQSDLEVEL